MSKILKLSIRRLSPLRLRLMFGGIFRKRSKSVGMKADVDEQKMPRSMKLLFERAKKLSSKKKKRLKRLGKSDCYHC